MHRLVGILGITVLLGLGVLFSTNRRAIRFKIIAIGLALQFAFALFVLRVPFGRDLFARAGHSVDKFLGYSEAGASFVFGELGKKSGNLGFFFAFSILPTIIFVAAFFAVMYHYG